MFIMARATAPMLPGCAGSTRTMRIGDVESLLILTPSSPLRFRASLFVVQPLLNIAVRAARRAGEVIVRSLNRVDTLTVTAKGRNDFVTEVDQAAEREIIASIRRSYPDHAFLAEESGVSGNSDTVWIIDPLDGTTNFMHSLPVFAVSIACQIRGRLEHAVVYDPMRQEIFAASRGGGAHVDNRRLRVSSHKTLEGALIGTGFPYRENTRYLDEYLGMMKAVIMNTAGVRRPGAASLDLAYVAAGRLDAFWEIGLSPWDTAAGTLLIQEAGGRIGTLSGGEYTQGGNILCGTPKVYEAMLELLAPHLPEALREG
jgi:myo-inositol-1(or 4)-monophosphatase